MKITMTNTIAILALSIGVMVNAQNNSPYMGGHFELTELPNGGIINEKAVEYRDQVIHKEPKVVHITKGVWSLEGFSFVNCAVIEGETGLIVYDTGDDLVDGQSFLDAIRTVSDKPIKTIIYSHSHYVWGSKVLLEGVQDYTVIGHKNINKNVLESGGLGASVPELAPVLMARAYEQFEVYSPKEGPDAPLANSPIGKHEKGFVPVTQAVNNGETLTIDGVKMQFFTDYHSDTDDCLSVYFPEKGVALNNLYWPAYPNLYTLRGSIYRDPSSWMKGLQVLRDLKPEHLINTHAFAVSGKENVFEALTNYYDGMAYMYDQTLRHILLGESPDEMRHTIQLPKHLDEWPNNQRTYGESNYYPPNIYNYALGWYDGNATNINPVHPNVESAKIVEGFGGKEKVMEAIKTALNNEEYAWATQLSDYLYKVYPKDQEVRQLKAYSLRKMGQITVASIPRSWYLTQARALENKIEVHHVIMPTVEQVIGSAPGTYVNMMRVRINPEKSMGTDKFIAFEFTDVEGAKTFGLHIRRGVAEYVENPKNHYKKVDLTIKLSRANFAKYYTGIIDTKGLLKEKNIQVSGSKALASKLLLQFDWFDAQSSILKYN